MGRRGAGEEGGRGRWWRLRKALLVGAGGGGLCSRQRSDNPPEKCGGDIVAELVGNEREEDAKCSSIASNGAKKCAVLFHRTR